MSSQIPIKHIDLRVFAHATEDTDKVLNAVRNILPADVANTVVFKKTNLAGHHGNPIILFEARIKEKNAVKALFEKLSSKLSPLDKEQLKSEINQHLDKGNLYIRLDKQSAYLNELKLCTADPIHLKMHFKKSSREEIIKICRDIGFLP
ncbi:MAG: RNA-binding domain-containing protein [Candidatus Bathyarchaeia archaeon]